MKKYRTNLTLNQPLLLPPRLDDWLPKGHLVYFIIDVVEMLDLSELTGRVQSKDPRGARPYDPKQLLTLLFYGYATGGFSSRRLARACEDNVACRIIMGSQLPHFTVIAAFRRRHLDLLPGLFTQVGQVCLRAGLIGGENVVLDGTKIKANASRHAAMSYERMKQDEARLAREIEEWLRKAEQQDEQDESDTETNSRDAAMAEVKQGRRDGSRGGPSRACSNACCSGRERPESGRRQGGFPEGEAGRKGRSTGCRAGTRAATASRPEGDAQASGQAHCGRQA